MKMSILRACLTPEFQLWRAAGEAHPDTAPGARPSGRFNVQTSMNETIDFGAGSAQAAQTPRSTRFLIREAVSGCAPAGDDRGFSLVEVLVVMSILSLIVLALMSVFSSTQRAFRASVTQTDVLQGGRAAMELMTSDLRNAAPCDGYSWGNGDPFTLGWVVGVNFFVTNNSIFYTPLPQTLPGSAAIRTNLLQWFFVLSRQNTEWTATGYIVNTASTTSFYPLYRYYYTTNVSINPAVLFTNFVDTVTTDINANSFTNMSHLIDGVVHLVVHAYDNNGFLMNYSYSTNQTTTGLPRNTWFTPPYPPYPSGEVGFVMSSNALPATVEVQMGVLEDRAQQRVMSLGIPGQPVISAGSVPTSPAQWTYLQGLSGRVQIFRERVTIENMDPTAYQ
jgi:prepilin-type N-terminal cleavage/methylation domain-containing protein